jgi:hypothetical protein
VSLPAVIAKVQKLLRLAKSDNANEAANAAAAADRLIQEHGLAQAQLEADGVSPAEAVAESDAPLVEWSGRRPAWQYRLVIGLVTHYDCASYTRDYGTAQQSCIVGRASDVEATRYMYAWLVVEIERLAQTEKGCGRGRAWLNSYRHGAVQGVIREMRWAKEEARETATSAALVLVDDRKEAADLALDKLYPKMGHARAPGGATEAEAFVRGRDAGAKLHDRKTKLDAGETRRLV